MRMSGNLKKNNNNMDEITQEPDYDMPVLEAGDVLFGEFNEDYQHNAIISAGIDKFFLFSDGYKKASRKLFQQLDGNAYDANTIVYRLFFGTAILPGASI